MESEEYRSIECKAVPAKPFKGNNAHSRSMPSAMG
jgi:hypothetical protein